ncbi:MAG: magnesium/cobalt transporter CorA [Phycisphaerales bacterium]|nr:magnesium/cobalt transporter CorA [Phycisphaerales bacterium]
MSDAPSTIPSPIDSSEIRPPLYRLILWNPREFRQEQLDTLESAHDILKQWEGCAWLDIECAPMSLIEPDLVRLCGLHPIAADTLRNGPARAKVQDFGTHLLATMIFIHGAQVTEVIDFVATDRLLVTVQERPGDCFTKVREQLRDGTGRVRALGPQFLLLQLGRAIAESYRPLITELEKKVDKLEDALSMRADRTMLHKIHYLRVHLLTYRDCVSPLRDSIAKILAQPLTSLNETRLSLRELEDEFAALQEVVDFQRERVQRLMDLYLNAIANRANEVMKVLTIISTIFMPLSFIASVYGMNFVHSASSPWNMPELEWEYGYLYALGTMGTVALAFLWFFWRKGWIGTLARFERKQAAETLAQELAGLVGLSHLRKGRARRIARASPTPIARQR